MGQLPTFQAFQQTILALDSYAATFLARFNLPLQIHDFHRADSDRCDSLYSLSLNPVICPEIGFF
ncbi:MAG TPA: hypothetical protein V6D48_21740 [Oculatellaceae cyanobacterium]